VHAFWESAISTAAAIAASVSIFVSLWLGVAMWMGIRSAERLPAPTVRRTRVVFGLLTFVVWYAAMLAGVTLVAMVTVRSVRQVGWTVLSFLALAAAAFWLRRRVRRSFVPMPAVLSEKL
jgi:hypothetical protein